MATVLDEIIDSVLKKLVGSNAVDAATLERLQELFRSDNRLTADDILEAIQRAEREAQQ